MKATPKKIGALIAALACFVAIVVVCLPAMPNAAAPVAPRPASVEQSGDSGNAPSSDAASAETTAYVADEAAIADGEAGDSEGDASGSSGTSGSSGDDDRPAYEQGVALVTLADSVSADAALETLRSETGIDDLSIQMSDSGFAKVSFSSNIAVDRAVDLITRSSVVEGAQPNFYYYPMEGEGVDAGAPSDAGLTVGRGFDLSPQAQSSVTDPDATKWVFSSIEAYDAWDTVEAEKTNNRLTPVTVAVIDTSFVYNHEDFQGTYFAKSGSGTGTATIGFIDPCDASSGKAEASTDLGGSNYHGMHVAGIVAAQANNDKGGAGTTYNNVRVMPVKVQNSEGDMTTENLLAAYDYIMSKASADNVRVVNVSLGTSRSGTNWGADDRLLFAKIDQAFNANIVTVVAACNKSADTPEPPFYCYPGDYDKCVTVISLKYTGTNSTNPGPGEVTRLESSNYNRPGQKTKDISAPGYQINNTYGSGISAYQYESGTSMATPVVSSVLALMFEVNKDMTAEQAVAKLYSTTRDIGTSGWDEVYGYGEVNAKAAVQAALTTATVTGSATLNKGTTGTYTLTLPSGVELGDNAVEWSQQGADQALEITGSGATCTVKGVKGGTGTLVAKVTIDGTQYIGSMDVTVAEPAITGKSTVSIGDTATYTVSGIVASGSDWTWSSSNATVATVDANGKLTALQPGKTTLTATWKSDSNVTASLEVTVDKIDLSSTTNGVSVKYARPTYTGSPLKPTITVKKGDLVLKEGTDFKIEFSNNIDAGTKGRFKLVALANGKCKNSETYILEIYQASVRNASVTLWKTSYTYTGSANQPAATVTVGGRTLKPGTDYTMSYSNATNVGTATATITGKGNYKDSTSKTYLITASTAWDNKVSHRVQYRTHVQNIGWQGWVRDGAVAGTSGRSLRLEAINIALQDHPYSGSIQYRTHVQNIGWQGWRSDGALSGTSGQALRLEAIQIRLTGEMANHYDVYYRVHAQNIGWMGWAKNGASAGTAGYSYRLEAIQVELVPKGSAAPGSTAGAFRAPQVQYRTHVQNVGWQDYVSDGAVAGTSGRSLRLEGINLNLGAYAGIAGGIQYRTHVQNIGWQGWRADGAMSGTSGRSLRLEAIQIRLTGAASSSYDVYYRVHCQNIGWMGWAKNGASAGTAGYSYRLEAIQVRLVPKGGAAPGPTIGAFRQR